jgi:pyruvate dehydrogenase E2 component (dihydrolipoamide acetyltransferase)
MEVETDKATVEIEAAASGILANITAAEGDDIPVGNVIALIVAPGEVVPQKAQATRVPVAAKETMPTERPATASPVAARIAAEHNVNLSEVKSSGSRIGKADVLAHLESQPHSSGNGVPLIGTLVPASPKARRLAGEQGIGLHLLEGSGPGGAVIAADVINFAPLPAAAPPDGKIAISTTWRVMAERLSQTWSEVPHFYLMREVDATQLIAWREVAQKSSDAKITFTDLLVMLVARTLKDHPRVNSSWQGDSILVHEDINVGLAVAIEAGLIVPVIHQADQRKLEELALQRKALVERAQAGRSKLEDLQGGTFTISNLGMYGIDAFNAIVNPPQAAILAVGRIADRVVAENKQPVVKPMMVLTLSCDHRAVDGARGAEFLDALAGVIEQPMRILD